MDSVHALKLYSDQISLAFTNLSNEIKTRKEGTSHKEAEEVEIDREELDNELSDIQKLVNFNFRLKNFTSSYRIPDAVDLNLNQPVSYFIDQMIEKVVENDRFCVFQN